MTTPTTPAAESAAPEKCPHCGCPLGEKLAPVQGYKPGIPWSMHLRAYNEYCKRYGPQQALIEGWCRGGFGDGELDMFIPGWREEVSVMAQLKAQLTAAKEECGELRSIVIKFLEADYKAVAAINAMGQGTYDLPAELQEIHKLAEKALKLPS